MSDDLTIQELSIENLYELRGHIRALEDVDGWIRVNKKAAISMINQLLGLMEAARSEYSLKEENNGK